MAKKKSLSDKVLIGLRATVGVFFLVIVILLFSSAQVDQSVVGDEAPVGDSTFVKIWKGFFLFSEIFTYSLVGLLFVWAGMETVKGYKAKA